MRVHRFRAGFILLVVAGSLLTFANAYTVPRYSAKYEQDCNLCHFNPTGGGQRATYASQYLIPEEMSIDSLTKEEMERFSPQISSSVTLGADLRTFFFSSDLESPLAENRSENFMQMQGNLYLALQMTDRISAHLSKGISTSYEMYGLGYVLPLNGYVKVGRFVPAFGWRFADHTSFVRDWPTNRGGTQVPGGFFPPSHTDVGLEVGFYPNRFAFNVAVMNGQLGATQDFNSKVALVGRALYRWNVGGVAGGLGGSVWRNETGTGTDTETRTVAGPLGYLHWKRLTWVGEADFDSREDASGNTVDGMFTSNQLTFEARKGVHVKGVLDFWDPNSDLDSGTRTRYGGGVEVMPYPFVRLEAMIHIYRNGEGDEGMDISGSEYEQLIAQVHLLY